MNGPEMLAARKLAKLSQAETAAELGISTRNYQRFEGADTVPSNIALGMERLLMRVALEKKNPMIAPVNVRSDALELAALIKG